MITYGQRLAETFSQVGKRFRKGAGPMLDIGIYPLTVATTILGPVSRVWGLAGIAIPEREIATGPLAGQRFAVEVPFQEYRTLDVQVLRSYYRGQSDRCCGKENV